MKKVYVLALCLIQFALQAQEQKVVGYIDASLSNSVSNANKLQWENMTDFIYGFIQPDASGNFPDMSGNSTFQSLKTLAANNNVHFHFSAGGAALGGGTFTTIGNTPSIAANFAKSVADLLATHNMKGFDLDWEFPRTATEKTAHLNILKALDTEFTARGKKGEWEVAIAVGGETPSLGVQGAYHTDYLDPDVFNYIDYLNIMSYDVGSSLAGNNHSSLEVAQKNIIDWAAKGCPKSKMVLGVPFYSRGSTNRNSWKKYSAIAGSSPSTAFNSNNSGTDYYNGKPLLDSKVDLTQTEGCAGLMIWEITYDLLDADKQEFSLLKAIGDRMAQYGCNGPNLPESTSLCGNGTATLNTGLPSTNRTFTWKYNGSNYTGSDQGNSSINVSQPGTYTVAVDSAGECTRNGEIEVSNTLGTIDLGDPIELCNPPSVVLDAGLTGTGYTYEWKNGSTVVGDGPWHEIREPGTYTVKVSAGACEETDQVVVTSLLPTVSDQNLCPDESTTFTVTGNGQYKWCSDSECNNKVGEGNTFTTPTLSGTTLYYVKDTSAFETSPTGPSMASMSSVKNYSYSKPLIFDAEEGFTIKSIKVGGFLYGTGGDVTLSIDKGAVNYGTATITFPDVQGATTVDATIDITLPQGTDYELTINGTYANWYGAGMTYPQTYENLITFKSFNMESIANSFPNISNWVLSSGNNCAPKKVVADMGICTNTTKAIEQNITIYPNPSHGKIHVIGLEEKNYSYQIINTSGRSIETGFVNGNEVIDVSGINNGLYLLQLNDGVKTISKRIIIE